MSRRGEDPSFAERLLAWFREARRDLPWRRTRDSWAIWVSEVMLQQTRVEAVREKFEQFLERYPAPCDFAAASDDALLEAWRGLGYYRRARLLRDGARVVVRDYGGELPRSAADLGRLPGIGAYTRGAVASIAFGEPVAAVDGNVERVFARHAGIRDNVKTSKTRREIEALVMDRMDPTMAGDFNQALMELGATVCKPGRPECGACPVWEDCVALRDDLVAELPVLPARKSPTEVGTRAVFCRDDATGAILASRNPAGSINEGQLELPGPGVLVACGDALQLESAVRERHDCRIAVGPELASVKHGITHHRITLTVHLGLPSPGARSRLERAPAGSPLWSTIARKALRKLDIELDAS